MVEGPGCTLNGEKLRAFIGTGKKLLKIQANGTNLKKFENFALITAESLGKELFLFFDRNECIRLHFGMSGSVYIGSEKSSENPDLVLSFFDTSINIYKTTFQILDSRKCKRKIDQFKEQDVCSSIFSSKKVFECISQQNQDRLVVDILLDQKVMPGVGNIIKNEALYDSFINPTSKIADLSELHIQRVIRMARDFTTLFYQCRKSGKSLHKYCRVYNRKTCLECSTNITVCRLGNDLNRMTYFCPNCQDNDLSKQGHKANLLRWIYNPNNPNSNEKQVTWICSACTFENKGMSLACSICRTEKQQFEAVKNNRSIPKNSDKKNIPDLIETRNLLSEKGNNSKIQLTFCPGNTNAQKRSLTSCSGNTHALKRLKHNTNNKDPPSLANQSQSVCKQVTREEKPAAMLCPVHRKPCIMKTVHKSGVNQGRVFYACGMPRAKQCKFFKWGDLNFPLCNHGKRTVLRTVLKLGPNNGKCFFSCGQKKENSCGFFKWAEDGHIVPLTQRS